jgi:hypothetical protein
VQLQIDALTVRVCNDDETSSAYRFTCPGCEQTVHREASPRIVDLLVSAGAPHELWKWPAELAEHRSGPPLTHDDLLDLHVLLEDETWFQQLVALVRSTAPE